MKKSIEATLLAAGVFLYFGLFSEPFRNLIGSSMDPLLGPLGASLPLQGLILVLAILSGVLTTVVQRHVVDPEATRRVQERMRAFQKEYREAMASKNKFRVKQLEKERAGVFKAQGEISRQSMKTMFIVPTASFPLFLWMWWYVSLSPDSFGLFHLPLLGGRTPLQLAQGFIPYWIVWYILCSIPAGQMMRKYLDWRDAKKKLSASAGAPS